MASTLQTHGPLALTTKRASTLRLCPRSSSSNRIAIGDRSDRGDGAAIQNVGAARARIEQDGKR